MPLLAAPAKLNLTVEVLARKANGFHGVRSVMVPIGLCDTIEVEPSPSSSFACDDPALGSDNIVMRALTVAGCEPARVVLHKRIPVGGGLGGGSSDAAAVLRAAMQRDIVCSPSQRDWVSLARSLGSDVPFFLVGTGALVEGTGDRLTALGALPPWWCVVVQPDVAVDTAHAYRLLDAARDHIPIPVRSRSNSVSLSCTIALQRSDFGAVRAHLHNDFHDVILSEFASIARAHDALLAAGAQQALLCGSGSCVFTLCATQKEARALESRLERAAIAQAFVAPLVTDRDWQAAPQP